MQGQHRQQQQQPQQQGSGYPPAYNMPQTYGAPQMQQYSHPAPAYSTVGAPVMYQAQQQPQPQPPPGPLPPQQQMSMPQQGQQAPPNMQSSPRGKSPPRDGDRPNGRQAKRERGDGDRGGDNKRRDTYQPPLV
jgi:hypothetical protein